MGILYCTPILDQLQLDTIHSFNPYTMCRLRMCIKYLHDVYIWMSNHTQIHISSTLAILWHCQFEKIHSSLSWAIIIVYVWHHSHIDIKRTHKHAHTILRTKIVYGELYISRCKCKCKCARVCSSLWPLFKNYAISMLFAHLNFGFKSVVIAAKYMTLIHSLDVYLSLPFLPVSLVSIILSCTHRSYISLRVEQNLNLYEREKFTQKREIDTTNHYNRFTTIRKLQYTLSSTKFSDHLQVWPINRNCEKKDSIHTVYRKDQSSNISVLFCLHSSFHLHELWNSAET